MRVKDKVAIVSGTGPNIGQEIARVLAQEGAKVVCADYVEENARRAAQAVQDAGGEAIAVQVDIRREEDVERMVAVALERYGAIHILVNNAAITVNKNLLTITPDEWKACLDVILTGTFYCCRHVARAMIERGIKGVIINIASTSGHRGRPNAIAYCTAKAGILNMTRAMAVELAPYGIRVNSVSPTRTGTPVGKPDSKEPRTAPEIPLGRIGHPRDQAYAVLYLASDEASFVTGIDLRVDGGALATWGVQEGREPLSLPVR
jgi:NAD(P)-dependent dehydrogenase (short-subunit alcohol dehydrogenase family)